MILDKKRIRKVGDMLVRFWIRARISRIIEKMIETFEKSGFAVWSKKWVFQGLKNTES